MDEFTFDLDKALDELENSEEPNIRDAEETNEKVINQDLLDLGDQIEFKTDNYQLNFDFDSILDQNIEINNNIHQDYCENDVVKIEQNLELREIDVSSHEIQNLKQDVDDNPQDIKESFTIIHDTNLNISKTDDQTYSSDNEIKTNTEEDLESTIKSLINEILEKIVASQNEDINRNQICENFNEREKNQTEQKEDSVLNFNKFNPEELSINLNSIQTQSSLIDELLDSLISKETIHEEKLLRPDSLSISKQKSQSQAQLDSSDSYQACAHKIQVVFNENQQRLDQLEEQLNSFSGDQKALGHIAPDWIPDSQTDECMLCSSRFTFTKRRHHCRSCGLIFCASCCNHRLQLPYNLKELSRLCENCYETINTISSIRNEIEELNRKIKHPIVSVLKKDGKRKTQDSNEHSNNQLQKSIVKTVRFSDGIVPGCDLSENDPKTSFPKDHQDSQDSDFESKIKKIKMKTKGKLKITNKTTLNQIKLFEHQHIEKLKVYLSNELSLPPLNFEVNFNELNDNKEYCQEIFNQIKSTESNEPVTFSLLKNFKINVKILSIAQYSKKLCWLFATQGLCINSQDELVYIIETNEQQDEVQTLKQIIIHLLDIYDRTLNSYQITTMSHTINSENNIFLGNKDNVGFLYFTPNKHHSFVDIDDLLPEKPFLIGILIQRWEIPWAKLFPIRLLLALGAQSKVYPCPVVSLPQRKATFSNIGQTIMNLLCDVRNFQYTLPQIIGLKITITDNETKIIIPQSQYDSIMKSILTSNDYVFSIGALEINEKTESYLVAIENENSNGLVSRTMSKYGLDESKKRTNVGCAFVVFNGSLRTNLGKLSLIEDGIMIQIDMDMINKLKTSLKEMKSFKIECLNQDVVYIEWTKDDEFLNVYTKSPIDNLSMCGIKSFRIKNSFEFSSTAQKTIRWSEIFLIKFEELNREAAAMVESSFNLNRFSESIAKAFCIALSPLIDDLVNETQLMTRTLKQSSILRVALRISINSDEVNYQIGSNGQQITDEKYLIHLDNELIPILHSTNAFSNQINLSLEFLFLILDCVNL